MKNIIACIIVFAFAASLVFAYGSERRPRGRRGHRNGRDRWDHGRKGRKGKPGRGWDETNQYASVRAKSVENETPRKNDQDPYMFSNTWGNDIFGTWPDEDDNSWETSSYSSWDDDSHSYGGGDYGWDNLWDDDWYDIWKDLEVSLDWDFNWENEDNDNDYGWYDYDYSWNDDDSLWEDIFSSWHYDDEYGWNNEILADGNSWNEENSQTASAIDTAHIELGDITVIQEQTPVNYTNADSSEPENATQHLVNQTSPEPVMPSPSPIVQSNVINTSVNITTLGEILKLMELNAKNLPKEEQYSLKTLKDLVDTISIADALFDADRSWVCDVIKSNQLLKILKTILENDSEYLDSFKKPREDDEITENGSMDAGVGGTEKEKEKRPIDYTGIASGGEQKITEQPVVVKDNTNSWSSIVVGNMTAVRNETEMNDTVVKTEYGKPPVLYVTTNDGDENSKAFGFNLVHAEAEKLPGKSSRGETELSTKYSRKRSADNFVMEPRKMSAFSGESDKDGGIMNKTETRSMKSGNPEETGNIQLAKESWSKTENSRARSLDDGDSVGLNDAETKIQEDIVNQIIYKRMFFSFLGKMCGVHLLPGDTE